MFVGERRPDGKNRHERRVGGDGIEADPGFGGAAAPSGVDEPDRDVLALFDLASEEIGYGGELGGGGRGAKRPGGGLVAKWIVGGIVANEQEANVGTVGCRDFLGSVLQHGLSGEALEGHFHVGLAGSEPDVSDENVRQNDGVGGGNAQFVRPTGVLGREVDFPVAEAIGNGRAVLIAEGHLDTLARVGPSPDVDGGVALQNGVVAERCWEA